MSRMGRKKRISYSTSWDHDNLGHRHQLTCFPSCVHLALHLCSLHPSLHLTICHSLPCHIPVPAAIVRCPLLLKPFWFQSDNVPRLFSCFQLWCLQPPAFALSLMFPSPSLHHSFFLSLPLCPPNTACIPSWLINIVPLVIVSCVVLSVLGIGMPMFLLFSLLLSNNSFVLLVHIVHIIGTILRPCVLVHRLPYFSLSTCVTYLAYPMCFHLSTPLPSSTFCLPFPHLEFIPHRFQLQHFRLC